MKWIECKAPPSSMMVMPRTGKALGGITLLLASIQPASALEYHFDKHQFNLGFRPRIGYVESDQDARELSALVRLRVLSGWTDKLSTLVEVDHVELGWEDEFSNGENLNGKPVIPDVAGTDLNQALLRYSLTNSFQLALGREALNLGNERFVGTNSFWQNEQTLDIAGFRYGFGDASFMSYRYLDNANRIFGDDAGHYLDSGQRPARFLGDHEHQSHLLFAEFKEWDYSQVQAYYFDMNIKDARAMSNKTLGVRYEFRQRMDAVRTQAHAEVALQERPEVNEGAIIPYYNFGVGLGYGSSEVSINLELLGENDNNSFMTPLSSLHDFNGWADKFLVTPETGLRDYFAQYIWRKNLLKIDARYHLFYEADSSSTIGKELDVGCSIKFDTKNTLLLTFADFSTSDALYVDERRVFLQYIHDL